MTIETGLSLVNGRWAEAIPVRDRGLAYGHGVFETARLCEGKLALWPLHLERMVEGAKRLSIPLDCSTLQAHVEILCSRCPADGVVKVIVTAGVSGRGYRPSGESEPLYILQWLPLPDYPREWGQQGISLRICDHRLSANRILAGIKHLNRLDQVLARIEWQDEYQEGLMLDLQDRVIEGTCSNLFCSVDGKWLTPVLDNCGVAGVLRRYLMQQLFPLMDVAVEETSLAIEDLQNVDEIFMCNSIAGIWPVRRIEGLGEWFPGSGVQTISSLLAQAIPCYK